MAASRRAELAEPWSAPQGLANPRCGKHIQRTGIIPVVRRFQIARRLSSGS
jgi:hypothetical protein